MQKGFIRAADVAAHVGVSRSMVSRAFTPGGSVSDEMRQRIEHAAATLGYRVNRLAKGLMTNTSDLVGLVTTNLDSPFNAAILSETTRSLAAVGLNSLLFHAPDGEAGITRLVEQAMEFRARAVVVLSGSPSSEIVTESLRSGLRVVLVNKLMADAEVDAVLSDDEAGGRMAAERLVSGGAKRVAVVASASRTPNQRRRIEAFCATVRGCGLDPLVWAEGATNYDSGRAAARVLLAQGVEGVFCVTDLLALGFMDGARLGMGLRIPQDVGVVGFDDIQASSWSSYGLTTIRQSVAGLAQAAVELICRPGEEPRRVIVPVEWVERGSVRGSLAR